MILFFGGVVVAEGWDILRGGNERCSDLAMDLFWVLSYRIELDEVEYSWHIQWQDSGSVS